MRRIRFSLAAMLLAALSACGGGTEPTTPPATTGSLTVQVQGLTGGGTPSLQVTGPNGFTTTLTSAQTLTGLAPGSYSVAAAPVAGTLYAFAGPATPASVQVSVGGSASVTVTYTASSGALNLVIEGQPAGVLPSVQLAGPGGFTQTLTASTTLSNLAPGSYTVTAPMVSDVGIGYVATSGATDVTAGATAARTITYALAVNARSTTERTDDSALPQVKFLYVLPSDGADRNLDTDRTIHRTVSSWQRWFAGQAGGRRFRFDTFQGALDIAFVRLARTEAQYAGYGITMRDSLEKDLAALGFNSATKAYAVYFDGINTTACGSAPRPPALPGRIAGLYLKGTPPGAPGCATNAFAASPTSAPGYLEFIAVHEILHILGIVDAAAPNHAFDGHVGNDPRDLMYAGAQPWTPSLLDATRTNYFNTTSLGGLINLAQSPYLVVP
ncbi:MAG: hypothetical protein IPP98_08910 [Gemmatimonadetes bacterium]|nr:hypothetical protein [Gemmatimonadota bacterium]